MFGFNRVNANSPAPNAPQSPQTPPTQCQNLSWPSQDAADTTQRSHSAAPQNEVLPQGDAPSPHFDFSDWHHGAGGSAAADGGGSWHHGAGGSAAADGGGSNNVPLPQSASTSSISSDAQERQNGSTSVPQNAGGDSASSASQSAGGGSASSATDSGNSMSSAGTYSEPSSASVGQASSTWAPMGNGPYTINLKNSSSQPQTITLTGNGQQPVSKTLQAGQTMALTLPAGYSGNVMSTGPNDPSGKGTLFEFSLGAGQGAQSWFDISNIVGHNISMVADGGPTGSGVGDSESTTLDHYVGPVDDSSKGVNPMKSTFGTTLNLNIGSEPLNTTSQPTPLGGNADFAARSAAMGISS